VSHCRLSLRERTHFRGAKGDTHCCGLNRNRGPAALVFRPQPHSSRPVMLYLLLNVIFASTFTLIIKWVQVRGREDIMTVGAVNYIVAAVWVLPELLQTEISGDPTNAMLTGGTMGACYFVAFFFVVHAIRWVGAASATVIGVLSILLPIGCGILIWSEQPDSYQAVGVALALLSLLLISGKRNPLPVDSARPSSRAWVTPVILISFFLLAGLSRLSQEAFKHESVPDHRPVFLFTAFAVTAIPSVVMLIVRSRAMTWIEFAFGFAMGASNILQTHFILKALQEFQGFVVFPVSSAGALLLTTLVATSLLGERLNRRTWWGIVWAVVAVVLLNW